MTLLSLRTLPLIVLVAGGLLGGTGAGWAQSTSGSDTAAQAEAGTNGFRLTSGDGAFQLRLRGDLYADARVFPGTDVPAGAESIFLRRIRPRLQGRVYERFAFNFRTDFGIGGPEIDDAFVEARFVDGLSLRMGRFKVPVGLENLQSTTGLTHVERGFPTGLAPGRDLGVMLAGAVAQNRLRYALGVFDGTPGTSEAGADVDNTKEGAARLFVTPFVDAEDLLQGLGIGIAGTLGTVTGTSAAAGLRRMGTTGRQTFFRYRSDARAEGQRWRVAPQARLFAGPVEVLGEYTVAEQDVRRGTVEQTLTHRAWQVSGSVVLTGEDAREGEVIPRDPFGRTRGTGAVEVGVRVHGVALDDTTVPTFAAPEAVTGARAWGLTLSWYPNAMVRMMLGYEWTAFEAAQTAPARESESVLLARMQVAF